MNGLAGKAAMLPAPQSDEAPDAFNQSKRPRTLQKAIGRAEKARNRKAKNAPRANVFKGIKQQHQADGDKSEQRQSIHSHVEVTLSLPARSGEGLGAAGDCIVALTRQAIGFRLVALRPLTLCASRTPPAALTHPRRDTAHDDAKRQRAKQVGIEW